MSRPDKDGHLLTVKHPLSLEGFCTGLQNCPDAKLVQFVLDGIENGVQLGPLEGSVDSDPARCKDGHAVRGWEAELWAIMQDEVHKGQKLGPFGIPPFRQFRCSPVSFVPKKDSSKVRLIHNLSHPFRGNSVNALVSPEEAAIQYQRFEDFIGMVRRAGHGAELGKFDLTDAYKYILVHPDYWPWLGIHVGSGPSREYYIETTLPFGHRLVPKIFTTCSDVLVWIAHEFGAGPLFTYVDDFASAQPAGSGLC